MPKFILFICLQLLISFNSSFAEEKTIMGDAKFEQILSNGDHLSSPFNQAQRNAEEEPEGELISKSTRIIAGRKSKKGEAPYLVLLQYKKNLQWCGGSIYSRDTIITAAHCFYSSLKFIDTTKMKVIAGEFDMNKLDNTEMKRLVKSVTIHPGYNPEKEINDIAIVQLDQPLRFTFAIQPIPIAKQDTPPLAGKLFIGGFGSTVQRSHTEKVKSSSYSTILKVASVDIVTPDECGDAFKPFPLLIPIVKQKELFCAGGKAEDGKTSDACQGDSGGPAACLRENNEKYLCGIVATGLGCGMPGNPGIYTRISHFSSWIMDNAGHPDEPTRKY